MVTDGFLDEELYHDVEEEEETLENFLKGKPKAKVSKSKSSPKGRRFLSPDRKPALDKEIFLNSSNYNRDLYLDYSKGATYFTEAYNEMEEYRNLVEELHVAVRIFLKMSPIK